MIIVVWSIALVVSLAPQIPQFKDPDYLNRIEKKKQCLVSQDLEYQIFATSSTFYVPLLVIFVLYWKIFQTARKRIRRRRLIKGANTISSSTADEANSKNNNFLGRRRFLRTKRSDKTTATKKKKKSSAEALVSSLVMMTEGQSTTSTMDIVDEEDEMPSNGRDQETTAFTITKPTASNNVSPEKSSTVAANNGSAGHQSEKEIGTPTTHCHVEKLLPPPARREKTKESLEAKRERKAAKTLAIITGAFVMCWLPFFILALLMPLCGEHCTISDYIMSFALWLGYFNSTLNPVIYTIFSPEFRQAFKRILCGGHGSRRNNFRSGKIR